MKNTSKPIFINKTIPYFLELFIVIIVSGSIKRRPTLKIENFYSVPDFILIANFN